jgi:hypothetical protein
MSNARGEDRDEDEERHARYDHRRPHDGRGFGPGPVMESYEGEERGRVMGPGEVLESRDDGELRDMAPGEVMGSHKGDGEGIRPGPGPLTEAYEVRRCRLTLSQPELKARPVSALETKL